MKYNARERCGAMESIAKKIQGLTLSKTEKKIADYILENEDVLGIKTATDLALEIGVSDTSIIRFLRTLGFSGYGEFKRIMSKRMLQQYNTSMLSSEKYIKTREFVDKKNVLVDVVKCAVDNMELTVQNTSIDTIRGIADCLIKSKRKYIFAFRGTACCADYMYRKLIYFLPDVFCCESADSSALERMVDITAGDCVLLYSFPRYSEINYSILELAKEHGAKVIVVTDKVTSPLAVYADYLLTASINGLGFTNSYVVPMCLSEAILLLVSKHGSKNKNNRATKIDEYLDKHSLY
ncbi:MAG: MurR/RpiR family transcriptional regulator [Acholeplasmataceae bacterium]|nr:MurR/RpiR family transcriptional regulator [Acholeplasmataceae bacterium]